MTGAIQVTINGNIVSGDVAQIAQILGMISTTITENVPVEEVAAIPELQPFNEFILEQITPHFGEELATQIVNRLDACTKRHYPSFSYFIGMYWKVPTIEKRQLLRTVSAVYRLKFGDHLTEGSKSSLRSEIKWRFTPCPTCGELAKNLILRLQQEGLISQSL
jgi:hypothetical protein